MKTIEDFKIEFEKIGEEANERGMTREACIVADSKMRELLNGDYLHIRNEALSFIEEIFKRNLIREAISSLISKCDDPECKTCDRKTADIIPFPATGTIH